MVEYERKSKLQHDIILGTETMKELGIPMGFKIQDDNHWWDHLANDSIIHLQCANKLRVLKLNNSLAKEPIRTQDANKRATRTLDAKDKKTDFQSIVKDKCKHLCWEIRSEFRGIQQLLRFRTVFPPEFWSEFCFSDGKTCFRQFGIRSHGFGILSRHRFFQFWAPKKVPAIFFHPPKLHLLVFKVKQVDVILAAWLFCPPKLHILVLSRCKFGGMIILPAKMTSTHFPSKTIGCSIGNMIVFPAKISSTCFE